MAQTPEGKVKKKVSAVLMKHGVYYFMPVQGGYGAATLDYLACHKGRFFSIETKAPGKKPTKRQEQTISIMRLAGAKVFVIDGDTTELEEWLSSF